MKAISDYERSCEEDIALITSLFQFLVDEYGYTLSHANLKSYGYDVVFDRGWQQVHIVYAFLPDNELTITIADPGGKTLRLTDLLQARAPAVRIRLSPSFLETFSGFFKRELPIQAALFKQYADDIISARNRDEYVEIYRSLKKTDTHCGK